MRLPAAFQHSIPDLAETAVSNLYMAGWDYVCSIWDTGKADGHNRPEPALAMRKPALAMPEQAIGMPRSAVTQPGPGSLLPHNGIVAEAETHGPYPFSAQSTASHPAFPRQNPGHRHARMGPVPPDGPGSPGWARFPRMGPVSPDGPGFPGWVRAARGRNPAAFDRRFTRSRCDAGSIHGVLAVASSSAQLILAHETAHPTRPAFHETRIP